MSSSQIRERSFYPAALGAEGAEAPLARLAVLHQEHVEIARLAELLARTPMAACALIIGGLLQLVFFGTLVPLVTVAVWALFVIAGALGLLRLVSQTERSSFELGPLQAFALDLNAMLLYAGFAWGAGAFLAVPVSAGALTLETYALGAALAIAAILRLRTPVLCFLVPSLVLAIAAALVGPGGFPAALAILFLGILLAATTAWAERRQARLTRIPALPAFTHS
jgi:hypothetical protein